MRRTLGPSAVVALALAFMLAVPALAASPFRFKELVDRCETSGGAHGFGFVKLKIRVREIGMSGANYFRVRSKAQYKGPNGGVWKTLEDYGWEYSDVFPDNSANYYHERMKRFDPDGTPDASTHRMWMKVQVWSNTQGLLASRVMTGQSCVTGL